MTSADEKIIAFITTRGACSSKAIFDNANLNISYATLKRTLSKLVGNNFLTATGNGKGTRYTVAITFKLIHPIDIENYYKQEIDERNIIEGFNFSLLTEVLPNNDVFSKSELAKLEGLQNVYRKNIAELTSVEYNKELERLAIDLSWKSSQIEGNTYSLLETERLLKDKETAAGKTKEEAIMLLNHKAALDFVITHPGYLHPLTISKIEDIHSLLIKDLGVERNLRTKRVGISGTNYRPLDNEFQIREALIATCSIINHKQNAFEKGLIALALISYVQPFMDGNKRTTRIVSNSILINEGYCPLSFRTVDSVDYKKAMLIFYEQNNISAFKEIFISQFEFAVNTYF
jgi:hypothetical protein